MAEFASFDGTTLYYEDEGSGAPVVLLHGLTSSTRGNWQEPGIWGALVAAGRRVIGLDARGHGRSAKPYDPAAYENDAMVKDVAAFLDHLELANTDLAGYSMGAGTSLRFAAGNERRLHRLVLGGIGGDPKQWSSPSQRRSEMAKQWLAGVEASDPAAIEDPVARRFRRVLEARGNDVQAIGALLKARRQHLSSDIPLEKVTVPTLVVCGDEDASPHELASALPDGESLVLEGDHISVVANPALAKAIVEFLAD
jgi:pimeloyl-ACP methyl ester carboxylesterase